MSIQAVAWVLTQSKSKGFARLVLISLANHANDDGECWPAQSTIASEAGIAKSSVAPQRDKLLELGEIFMLRAGNARQPSRYLLPALNPDHPALQSPAAGPSESGPGADAASGPAPDRTITEPSTPSSAPPTEPPSRARRRTPRDDLFDALVDAFGPASTPSRAAFYGKACTELVAASATPEQVKAAAAEMRRRGWESPTPQALVKNWDDLLAGSRPANPAAGRFWEQ